VLVAIGAAAVGCSGPASFDPTGHWDLDIAKTNAARQGTPAQNMSLDFGRDGSFALSESLVKGSWRVVDHNVLVAISSDEIGLLDHYGIEKMDGKPVITFDWSSAEARLYWKFYNTKSKMEREYWVQEGVSVDLRVQSPHEAAVEGAGCGRGPSSLDAPPPISRLRSPISLNPS
jgi:hypothetical protein